MIVGLFYLMAIITLGSALFVAASRDLVRSIFMFFITLFGLAGLYVFALADFVAITQIVIYVGGILVLILFAFMLSGKDTLDRLKGQSTGLVGFKNWPSLLLAVLFFSVLAKVITKALPDKLDWIAQAVSSKNVITDTDTTTANIGINLMTRYLLPFEAISILLLMVLIGAAHLARKEGTE
jgi:NADH-quinone oxidoreductase subunit J